LLGFTPNTTVSFPPDPCPTTDLCSSFPAVVHRRSYPLVTAHLSYFLSPPIPLVFTKPYVLTNQSPLRSRRSPTYVSDEWGSTSSPSIRLLPRLLPALAHCNAYTSIPVCACSSSPYQFHLVIFVHRPSRCAFKSPQVISTLM